MQIDPSSLTTALPSIFGSQMGVNFVSIYLLQALKNAKWATFIKDGPSVRLASIFSSAINASGLTLTWATGPDGLSITLSHLTMGTAVAFIWYVVSNFYQQKGLYNMVGLNKPQVPLAPPSSAEALRMRQIAERQAEKDALDRQIKDLENQTEGKR